MKVPHVVTPVYDKVTDYYKKTLQGEKSGRVLRFSEVKDVDGNKTGVKELSLKPHGIFAKTIRFFGGPTKRDIDENSDIKQQFYKEFKEKYPVCGDKIMEAMKFIKFDTEKQAYVFVNLKPLTVDSVYRRTRMGNYSEKQDSLTERRDPLNIDQHIFRSDN